ncbi:MAG: DUF2213 domain-containing protein, partial [Bacteroidales bacterium]|nr:DUF2213 domain-containing protein [Bacteroidales bacterium]
MTVGIANDKVSIKSAREYDGFGRLHVEKANISKETVNPYFGKEVPNWQSLGLESEKVYKLYRPQSELEKAADTFKRLPILSEHLTFTLDDPRKAETIGTIGSNVVFESPYLTADLSFWDKAAIGGIEENQ